MCKEPMHTAILSHQPSFRHMCMYSYVYTTCTLPLASHVMTSRLLVRVMACMQGALAALTSLAWSNIMYALYTNACTSFTTLHILLLDSCQMFKGTVSQIRTVKLCAGPTSQYKLHGKIFRETKDLRNNSNRWIPMGHTSRKASM